MNTTSNNGLSFQLNNRLKIIQEIQSIIVNKFGSDDFNIFLFGSFLTERYIEGKSDIDLAIYTTNFDKYLKIRMYLEDYFNNKNIPQDIFYIDTSVIAPIYCEPLSSPLKFTTYYPTDLKNFYNKCKSVCED